MMPGTKQANPNGFTPLDMQAALKAHGQLTESRASTLDDDIAKYDEMMRMLHTSYKNNNAVSPTNASFIMSPDSVAGLESAPEEYRNLSKMHEAAIRERTGKPDTGFIKNVLMPMAQFAGIAAGGYGATSALAGLGAGSAAAAAPAEEGFSLSNYLGLDSFKDTLPGKFVTGVKDAFSSPVVEGAKAASTANSLLGDKNKEALKILGIGGLSLLGQSDDPEIEEGAAPHFLNPSTSLVNSEYTMPSYHSIFDEDYDNSDDRFADYTKRYADGGDTTNKDPLKDPGALQVMKAVGYKGDPSDFVNWTTNNKDAGNNFIQSMRAINPNFTDPISNTVVKEDPYARYGSGPEKQFFTSTGNPTGSGTTDPNDAWAALLGTSDYDESLLAGLNPDEAGADTYYNRSSKRQANFSGGFDDPNEFYNWAYSNPDSFVDYLDYLSTSDPGYTPQFATNNSLDWNQSLTGNQAVGPSLNAALGRQVGYAGPVGNGELGSGLSNDYLRNNQDALSSYLKLRKIVEPTYNWTARAKGGSMGYGESDAGMEGTVSGSGGGKDDEIPAMLSDGEHVITAQEVSALGDGSNKEGQKKLYEFRKKIREHATKNKGGHAPKARPIHKYLKGK